MVHHDEDQGDGGRRRHHGQDGERPDQAPPPEFPVEQQGHGDPERRLDRDRDDGEPERPEEGLPDPGIARDNFLVVGHTDELRQRQAGGEPLLQAHPHGVDHGIDNDERHRDDGRGRKDEAGISVREPGKPKAESSRSDFGSRSGCAGLLRHRVCPTLLCPQNGLVLPPPGNSEDQAQLAPMPHFSVLSSISWNSLLAWATSSAALPPSIAFWMATPKMSRYCVTSTISGRPARPIFRLSR